MAEAKFKDPVEHDRYVALIKSEDREGIMVGLRIYCWLDELKLITDGSSGTADKSNGGRATPSPITTESLGVWTRDQR